MTSSLRMLALTSSLLAFSVGSATSQTEPVTALVGIQIIFKLDPLLSGPTYGGERWLSQRTFSSAAQEGQVGTVDVKVHGVAAGGKLVAIVAEWTAADPDWVTVTPGDAGTFRIVVKGAGESKLRVSSQGFSKELIVRAKSLGSGIQVEISQ